MTQTIVPFSAGEDPNGIAYSGTIENLYGASFLTIENYMSVYMVVGDFEVPPCYRRTITTDGVIPSMGWKIAHPSSFIITRKLNRAIISPTAPALQSEPLFPVTAPYNVPVVAGDLAGNWVASVLVQQIMIGDGNWFNPSIMGVTLAWHNMNGGGADYVSYRHKHDFAASVPFFHVPGGDGQSPFIPLPGVASVVTPDMTGKNVGAELSVTYHLGWLTI